ncbi:MAG TPA: hypothetical protein VFB65_12530 [Pyrinomonadaceae bacterium]|nr:hypothetical protein [Pyrinomonadaceae bacterium]
MQKTDFSDRGNILRKTDALDRLVKKRQLRENVYPGYFSIGHFHDGVYECNYVSPYTKSAGNLNAKVFIMLQDWASSDAFKDGISHHSIEYGHEIARFTNSNLKTLLQQHFGLKLSQTYGTNLFPFIKPGPMNAPISQRLLKKAALEYGLPQIDIIKPRLVICLGKDTFNALRASLGLGKVMTVGEGIEQPFTYRKTVIWLQAHTGMLGQNNRNRGGVNRVNDDWHRMAASI